MKTIICMAVLLMLSTQSSAETYSWVDENGTYNFSDDYNSVPPKYRKSAGRRGNAASLESPQNTAVAEEKPALPENSEKMSGLQGGDKQLYGGKTQETWRKELDVQVAELMRLEKRSEQIQTKLNKPVGISRSEYSALLNEYNSLRSEYDEKYKVYNDLIELARKAGLTVTNKK